MFHAGKRRAVAVKQMSVSVLEDGDGSDEYEDITNQTQYAGGKGSDDFDDL